MSEDIEKVIFNLTETCVCILILGLFFFQFYYPYALCYVTQIQMIHLSQTLHTSTNQTDKSKYENQKILHMEKRQWVNYSLETHSDFPFCLGTTN